VFASPGRPAGRYRKVPHKKPRYGGSENESKLSDGDDAEVDEGGVLARQTRKKRIAKAAGPTRVMPKRAVKGQGLKVMPDAVKSTVMMVPKMGAFRPLTGVLEMVAWKCGMCGADGDAWVEGMADKLSAVGVDTLREFVESGSGLNRRLIAFGHDEVGQATLDLMLLEVGEMIYWPGEWYAPCDM
jgi:hypothetical protein